MLELTQFSVSLTVLPRIRAAWWAVVARFLLHGLVVSTWVSRIPAIQSALGLTNARLGLCLLGTAVGSVVAVPVTGWLVARFGSKPVTSWSTAGFCLALAGPSFAWNGITLFCALAVFGAMAGANDVAINSQGVAVESALATPTMSRFHGMFSIGGMVGASVGGVLAARDILPRMHLSIAAAVFLLISVLTAPRLLETAHEAAKRPKSGSGPQLRRVPKVLLGLALIGFCMFLSEGAIADWSAVYLKQVLSAGPGLAAAAYAAFSVGMAICRLLGDHITARAGAVATVRGGALLAAASLSLALVASSPYWALPAFTLTGCGLAVIVPIVFGAGGRVPSVPTGAGVAMVSGSGYIGFLFGPPLIGLIAQWSSLRLALLVIVVLSLLAALLAGAVRGTTRSADNQFAIE
jgi:MFS family permease